MTITTVNQLITTLSRPALRPYGMI